MHLERNSFSLQLKDKENNIAMRVMDHKNREDIEATEDEMKGVCYTAISFLGFVTVLIGSIIFFLARH